MIRKTNDSEQNSCEDCLIQYTHSRHSSVSGEIRIWDWTTEVRFMVWSKMGFFLMATGSGAHPASNAMGTGVCYPEVKAAGA
jgi:hypothetical protein